MPNEVYCEAFAGKNSIQFSESDSGVAPWPHRWPPGELSYRLNNRSADTSERHQIRACTMAFRAIQFFISDIKFRRERNPTAHVDLNITFAPSSSFSSTHVFAHAWFPGQGEKSGDVEINDEDWDWVPGVYLQDLAHPPLVPVLIHEDLHGLGFRHNTHNVDSIMYPSFNLGKKKNQLHEDDILILQDDYGVRNLKPWQLDYFRRRRSAGWDFS